MAALRINISISETTLIPLTFCALHQPLKLIFVLRHYPLSQAGNVPSDPHMLKGVIHV